MNTNAKLPSTSGISAQSYQWLDAAGDVVGEFTGYWGKNSWVVIDGDPEPATAVRAVEIGGGGGSASGGCTNPQTYWELDPLNPDPENPIATWSGYYDKDAGEWVVTSGTAVDPANNFVHEVVGGSVAVTDPTAPVTSSFLETCVPSHTNEPTTLADVVTGHGYLKRRLWTVQQFENEGDAGGGLESPHSIIVEDADGVRTVEGAAEVTEINTTSGAYNETGANGGLVVWEGAIYRPEYYHLGTNAGKRVTTFRIYDAYTATNQSDADRIQIGVEGGYPSLDRSDLTVVAENQVGTSFDLPSAWAGRWGALALEHSDRGAASQVNWRIHLELDDGTVLTNQALNDWVWNIETKDSVSIPETTQSIVQRVTDPTTGVTTWSKDGATVDFDTLCQPIQAVESTFLPTVFDVIAIGGEVSIANVALGSGGPYEYSFDGGLTWQAGNTYSLGDTSDATENDIEAIYPMVRDSAGITSGITSPTVLVGDPVDSNGAALRTADLLPGVAVNTAAATISVDETDAGGWVADYGTLIADVPTNDLTDWTTTGTVTTGRGRIRFNLGSTSVGGATAEYATGETVPAGETGTFRVNARNVYYGNAATNFEMYVEVVDSVTGAVLGDFKIMDNDNNDGSQDLIWAENTLQGSNNNLVSFVGTGNPLNIRVRDVTTGGNDSTGHYWEVWNAELFDGYATDAASHFWSRGAYIEARGIAAPEADPATLITGVDSVADADLIRLTGNIVRVGTHVEGVDGFKVEYRLDGGAWVESFAIGGQWDAANERYLTPYETNAIDVSGASTIEQRLSIWSDGNTSKYWRVYDMTHIEVSP